MHPFLGRRSVHRIRGKLRPWECWFPSHLLSPLSPKLGAPWVLLVTSVPSDALSVGLLGRLHPEPQVQALPGAARKQRHGVWFPAGAAAVLGTTLDYHQCPAEPGVLTLHRRHQPLPCYCVASAAASPAVTWGCLESEGEPGGWPPPTKELFISYSIFMEFIEGCREVDEGIVS